MGLVSFGAAELLKCLGVESVPAPGEQVVYTKNELVVNYTNDVLEDMCVSGLCNKVFVPWKTTYSVSSYGLESLGKFYGCEFVFKGNNAE